MQFSKRGGDPWQIIKDLEEPGPAADRLDAEKLLLLCGFTSTLLYGTLVYYHATYDITFTFGASQREIPKPYLDNIVDTARRILEREAHDE